MESEEENLCLICLYRDGSCGDGTTSYGALVTSCHAFVYASENIWCWFGFHDWGAVLDFGSGYKEGYRGRECRRCRINQLNFGGRWLRPWKTVSNATYGQGCGDAIRRMANAEAEEE